MYAQIVCVYVGSDMKRCTECNALRKRLQTQGKSEVCLDCLLIEIKVSA